MSQIKPIRVRDDVYEYLRGKDARLLLESVCDLLMDGRLEFDSSGVKIGEGIKLSERDEKVLDEIKAWSELYGSDFGKMLKGIGDRVGEGEITMQDGEVYCFSEEMTRAIRKEEYILWKLNRACEYKRIEKGSVYRRMIKYGGEKVLKEILKIRRYRGGDEIKVPRLGKARRIRVGERKAWD